MRRIRVFRAMALIALTGHVVILAASALAGFTALAWFNIGSVIVYVLTYRCACGGVSSTPPCSGFRAGFISTRLV